MQSILDILQSVARQRGRGESSPLIMLRQLDGGAGDRISHLPVEGELGQAWVAMTGEPFRPHQAQALTALRRGEPVALFAASPAIVATGYLMLYAMLHAEPATAALLLARDEAAAQSAFEDLVGLGAGLPAPYALATALVEPGQRPDLAARIVVATPESLHNRLLRHHDRAWSLFWSRMRLTLVADLHRYAGVAGAHLADLLLRIQRVAAAHGGRHPDLLTTSVETADPLPWLACLSGLPWRVVGGDDVPFDGAALAVWRGPADRLREAAELALVISRQGYHVHVLCSPLETAALAPMIGDVEGVRLGPIPGQAHALICAGYPGSRAVIRRLLRSGYQAVVVALGDLPAERLLARTTESLLSEPPEVWALPPSNAYVSAQHVLCAASELPLSDAEVEVWGVRAIVDRLVETEKLVDLPDPEIAWRPTFEAGDPYPEFSLLSSSGDPLIVRNERNKTIDRLDPTGFERWSFLNAALPPGAGGLRVINRDDERGTVTVRLETNGRRTYPLRRCLVTVREERDSRTLFVTRRACLGRVVVDEEVYGYRESSANGAPADMALKPPLTARWTAAACWFELPTMPQVLGQMIGWTLAAALPLRVQAAFMDIVPCYDHESRRLYLVDGQPGGNGLAAWFYQHVEELLPLAYDVAYACRNDSLLEPVVRVDMDWLLALLGPRPAEQPVEQPHEQPSAERAPARGEAPIRPELVEGLPPPKPRVVLTPSPEGAERRAAAEERRASSDRVPQSAPARPRPPAGRAPPPRPVQNNLPLPERAPEKAAPPPAAGPPPAPTADEGAADPRALIERLRRQRERRERDQPAAAPAPSRSARGPSNVETRFRPGDRVFCLPYGDGVVRESRVEGDREMLTVDFPDHGELPIDPAVALVRKIEKPQDEDDDLL